MLRFQRYHVSVVDGAIRLWSESGSGIGHSGTGHGRDPHLQPLAGGLHGTET